MIVDFTLASSESNCGRPRVVVDGFDERDMDVRRLRAVLMEAEGAMGSLGAEVRELELRLRLCLCGAPLGLLSAGGVMAETEKNRDRRNSDGVWFALLEWHFSLWAL